MSLLKPSTCDGCPFKSRGRYWVPDEMVEGAEVVVLSQAPGADEEAGRRLIGYDGRLKRYEPCTPSPLTGTTGYDMSRKYLPLAGLERGKSVSLANPIRCRLDGTNELPVIRDKTLQQAVQHCQHHHYRPPPSTKLVVAEGAVALYAATGEDGTEQVGHKINRGVEGWRGWLLPWNPPPRPRMVMGDVYHPGAGTVQVLPTFHLSYLYRAPWYTPVSQRDWSKVQAILTGRWPEAFPQLRELPPDAWPARFAFDTEYYQQGAETVLTRYSMADRLRTGEPRLWVVERDDHVVPDWFPPTPTVMFHNVEADLDHLNTLVGHHVVTPSIEDSMYLHSCLWADLDHDLDFLGSIYSRHNRTKHLLRANPRVYAGGDALMTLDSADALLKELDRDPQVKRVYYEYQLPLAPIIHRARAHGLRVVPQRVAQALTSMAGVQADVEAAAQAHAGWPINLGSSQQVARELYDIEGVHLNPMTGRVRRA